MIFLMAGFISYPQTLVLPAISRRPKRCHPHRWSSTVIWLCPCLGWAKDGRKGAGIFSTSLKNWYVTIFTLHIYIYIIYIGIYIGYVIILYHFHIIYHYIGMSFFSILFHVENDDIAISNRVLFGLWMALAPSFGGFTPVGQRSGLGQKLDIKKQR